MRPDHERGLDDLMVSYSVAPLSIGSSSTRFGNVVEVSQALPHRGKRGLRAGVAAAAAEVAASDVATLRLDLVQRTGLLYTDWVLVHEALRINDEHAEILRDLMSAATERYVAGLASQQDPLAAEAALTHVLHNQAVLDSQRAVLRARLNTLLHRDLDAPLPPPPASAAPDAAPAGAGAIAGAVEERALASRPELRAIDADARARQAELELVSLERRPDFAVMGSYSSMWNESEHRVMLGGSVRLPVWRSHTRAGVAMAEERLRQVESERAAAEDAVREEVRVGLERLHESQHVLELFRSRLLPVAQDRVEAALAGFRSGKNDFLAVLDAERDRYSVELDYHGAIADLSRRQVDLERAVGAASAATGDAMPHSSANHGGQP